MGYTYSGDRWVPTRNTNEYNQRQAAAKQAAAAGGSSYGGGYGGGYGGNSGGNYDTSGNSYGGRSSYGNYGGGGGIQQGRSVYYSGNKNKVMGQTTNSGTNGNQTGGFSGGTLNINSGSGEGSDYLTELMKKLKLMQQGVTQGQSAQQPQAYGSDTYQAGMLKFM